MPMPYDAPPDGLDRDLILCFFWKFSVFECALKREGFLRKGYSDAALPNWNKFAECIRGRFKEVRIGGFEEAVSDLIKASPRQQVVRDGKLRWKSLRKKPKESSEGFVLRLLKTVRNNLFHGGKYPDDDIEEVARNKAILKAAMAVLDGCYDLHPGVAYRIQVAA
jgi:hypothetical protein